MALSITNENKNSLAISNAEKGLDNKWKDATWKWKNASGTWATQKVVLARETKNNIILTKDSK